MVSSEIVGVGVARVLGSPAVEDPADDETAHALELMAEMSNGSTGGPGSVGDDDHPVGVRCQEEGVGDQTGASVQKHEVEACTKRRDKIAPYPRCQVGRSDSLVSAHSR